MKTISIDITAPDISTTICDEDKFLYRHKLASHDSQTDIEDLTGRNPANAEKALGIAADRLRSLVDRIERLTEEKAALTSDIKDLYTEAGSAGFDVKVLRALIKERAKDAAEVADMQTMLDLYRNALGD